MLDIIVPYLLTYPNYLCK